VETHTAAAVRDRDDVWGTPNGGGTPVAPVDVLRRPLCWASDWLSSLTRDLGRGRCRSRAAWAGRGGCLDSPVAPRVAAWRCAHSPSYRPDGAHGVTVFLFGAAQLPLVSSPVSGFFFPAVLLPL